MAYRTASAAGVTALDAHAFARECYERFLFGSMVTAVAALAAAGLLAAALKLVATCLSFVPLNAGSVIRTNVPVPPGMIALAEPVASMPAGAGTARGPRKGWMPDAPETGDAAAPSSPGSTTPPLKPSHAAKGGPPPLAAAPAKRQRIAEAESAPFALPEAGSRTAIYDIAAHAVYLPNGEKLEAHSGLGRRLDDPRYVNVQNEGPTPPNVYNLALREEPFHGVRALRLIPAGDGNMFGRDGILAHSYMLGPSGQSNGCVSFANYPAFLRAFLNGEVERILVVARLPTNESFRPAQSRREDADRYALKGAGRIAY
jgi:hypothetical protein